MQSLLDARDFAALLDSLAALLLLRDALLAADLAPPLPKPSQAISGAAAPAAASHSATSSFQGRQQPSGEAYSSGVMPLAPTLVGA